MRRYDYTKDWLPDWFMPFWLACHWGILGLAWLPHPWENRSIAVSLSLDAACLVVFIVWLRHYNQGRFDRATR